jgi:hypothetical protein
MTTITISIFTYFLLYVVVTSLINGGAPQSLSQTYYILNRKKKGLGVLFTLLLWTIGFGLLPVLLEVSKDKWYGFVAFLTCAALCFVGTAPKYKSSEKEIHYVSAAISAFFCLFWVILEGGILFMVFYVLIALILLILYRKSETFWLEMVCFFSLFSTLLWQLSM